MYIPSSWYARTWKNFPHSWPFVRRIYRPTMDSHHTNGRLYGAIFSLWFALAICWKQSSYRWYGTPWHLFYIIVKLKFCVPLWVLYLLELAKPTQCRVCICHFDGLVKTTVSPLSIANALEILQSCLNHRFDHIKLWDVIIRFYANFNASSVGLAVLIRHISHGIVFIMTERHQLTLCGYPFIFY